MEQILKEIVNNKSQNAIIFAQDENKVDLEKQLLELSEAKTFIHVSVVSPIQYALNLLSKYQKTPVKQKTNKTSLLAIKHVIEHNTFTFFKDLVIDLPLLQCFLETFEILSDLDLSTLPFKEGLILDKWQELIEMFDLFKKERGFEYFDSEIYQMALDYIPENTRYYDFTNLAYSNGLDAFFKKCQVIPLKNSQQNNPELKTLQTQYAFMSNEFTIQQISDHLVHGGRYQDIIVYVPNKDDLRNFIEHCPYPTNGKMDYSNPHDAFFVNALAEYYKTKDEAILNRMHVDSNFIIDFERAKCDSLISHVSSETLSKLKDIDELSVDEFILLAPTYLTLGSIGITSTKDSITLTTYNKPYLAKHFKKAYLLGVNEGVFPSEVSEETLLLNDELQYFYHNLTPADRKNAQEEEIVQEILKQCDKATIICFNETLDGKPMLPSLLFKRLEKKSIPLTYGFVAPEQKQDTILEDYEARNGQPLPLQKDHILDIYHKKEFKLSPSELEAYNSCPYKYFLSYGLKIKPEKAKLEINQKMGNLMHNLLDECSSLLTHDFTFALVEFLKGKKVQNNTLWHIVLNHYTNDADALEKQIDLKLSEIRQGYSFNLFNKDEVEAYNQMDGSCLDAVLESVDSSSSQFMDVCLSEIVKWYLSSNQITPESSEERYLIDTFTVKFSNAFKVLLYTLKDGKFELMEHEYKVNVKHGDIVYHGRVDRIDACNDLLKVIDYKSSNKLIDKGLAIQGFNIQMLLYMQLLQETFDKQKSAVLYFNTSDSHLTSKNTIPLKEDEYTLEADKYISERSFEGLIVCEENHQTMAALSASYEAPLAYNFRIQKNGQAKGSSLISPQQFDKLLSFVFKRLDEIVDESFNQGNIAIMPAGSKNQEINRKVYPCAYCDYKNVCLRDAFYHESREIKKYSSGDIDVLLGGETNE